jgi:hypothetical protein
MIIRHGLRKHVLASRFAGTRGRRTVRARDIIQAMMAAFPVLLRNPEYSALTGNRSAILVSKLESLL